MFKFLYLYILYLTEYSIKFYQEKFDEFGGRVVLRFK